MFCLLLYLMYTVNVLQILHFVISCVVVKFHETIHYVYLMEDVHSLSQSKIRGLKPFSCLYYVAVLGWCALVSVLGHHQILQMIIDRLAISGTFILMWNIIVDYSALYLLNKFEKILTHNMQICICMKEEMTQKTSVVLSRATKTLCNDQWINQCCLDFWPENQP